MRHSVSSMKSRKLVFTLALTSSILSLVFYQVVTVKHSKFAAFAETRPHADFTRVNQYNVSDPVLHHSELDICVNCFPAIVVFSLIRVDLLTSLLASIDVVTNYVFVVCNFNSQVQHGDLLRAVSKYSNCSSNGVTGCDNPNIRYLHVLKNVQNVGFAGSFNLALKVLLDFRFPYVLFNNDDTIFLPGRLLAAKRVMDSTETCMFYFEGFSSFGISRQGIASLGPMDENFWPAYGEDCDYWFRAQLQNCSLYYRGGYSLDKRTTHGELNAFVSHGDGGGLSGTTMKSSPLVGKLVANTLHSSRGRFAYLVRKWGFNCCELFHGIINAPRDIDVVLHALPEDELRSQGLQWSLPYGPHANITSVNGWLKDDWKNDGSVSPRGVNSKWAPPETVWLESDDNKLAVFAAAMTKPSRNRLEEF